MGSWLWVDVCLYVWRLAALAQAVGATSGFIYKVYICYQIFATKSVTIGTDS